MDGKLKAAALPGGKSLLQGSDLFCRKTSRVFEQGKDIVHTAHVRAAAVQYHTAIRQHRKGAAVPFKGRDLQGVHQIFVVVGDGNGHVGAGLGKAAEIPEAIRKGKEDAAKKLIKVDLDENASIPHDYTGKFGGASVLLKRSPEGTGVIAGGPARNVLEMAGIKNIRTKSLGSNNKQNVVLATMEALKSLKSPEEVARLRGKSVDEILA